MNLTESQISSELLYDGSFIAISRDKVRLPNGNESQRVVVRGGAAVVVQRPAGLAPGTYVLQAQGAGGRWEWRVVME